MREKSAPGRIKVLSFLPEKQLIEMCMQMMCYVLGILELFDGLYDINEINMTIFQPRREKWEWGFPLSLH